MKPDVIHQGLAEGRWRELSLIEQLANVGSEVERTMRARDADRPTRFEGALARALELFDMTIGDARWRGPRLRELTRAREEFCALFFGTEQDALRPDPAAIRRYFLQFAVAARKNR